MNTRLHECLESSRLSAKQKSAIYTTTLIHFISTYNQKSALYTTIKYMYSLLYKTSFLLLNIPQPAPGVRFIKARSFEQEETRERGKGGVDIMSGLVETWLTGQTLESR